MYVLTLVITILAYQLPVPVNANDRMAPQISEDGKTRRFGLPLAVFVKDPNPPAIPRRIPAAARKKALTEKAGTATFDITYIPKDGKDIIDQTCDTFPEDAKTAFNAAAEIWGNILKSSVPITIKACWANLVGEDADTLGYAYSDEKKDFPGTPRRNTWYTYSLANALCGSDLDKAEHDMHITYNKNYNWYFGTDGNMPTCPDAIPNGNFDSGTDSWGRGSSSERDLIGQWSEVANHSGTWYTWLGGVHNETAFIEQTVTVPSSCPNLVFYHWIKSDEDFCEYDFGYVEVSTNGTDWDDVETIDLCSTNNTSDWKKKSIDLGKYADQDVRLKFRVKTDSSNVSNWFIDTVFFQTNKFDFVTVVLHEIGHGLNFTGTMKYSDGTGAWGYGKDPAYPNIYDVFIKDGDGKSLITYDNNSTALGNALTSDNLWFHGDEAMAANGGQRVKIYAPSQWSSGSSYSHLDYETFNKPPNKLMVYAGGEGEFVHDPGPVTKGLLNDLGWSRTSEEFPWILFYPAFTAKKN